VTIFFVVALFILAVACINFMNLATARSARRAKEVGLRKVAGAGRGQLIGQFLGESLVISLLAFILAMGMVWALLPTFNQLSGKELTLAAFDGKLLAALLGIAVGTGLIAGIYPALYLSGFKPAAVLKGKLRTMGGNLVLRNALVVTQFVVSIVLLVGTAVVYDQLSFIRNRNMGFDKQNLLYIPINGDLRNRRLALETELRQDPLTRDYTVVSDLPTNLTTGTGDVLWEGKDPKSQIIIPSMDVEEHFMDVFQTRLAEGRFFSDLPGDSNNYVVNEKALQVMGMAHAEVAGGPHATGVARTSAIGKSLTYQGVKGTIIGVVKDFNFKPVQQAIEPLVLRLNKWNGKVVIRIQPGNTGATIRELEKITTQLNPAYPFDYNFLDQDLANLYQGEQRMGHLFNIFAMLAIFISCLGLYGLSAFIAEQRTKEIGVRKVLGASVPGIVYLLSTNFTRLILVAVAVAIPISWWAMNNWLKGFAFRVDPGWGIYLGASFAALLIAWLTVSYESIRSAMANPVKSLRSE
jgi:ABC-type antimicrobial peptide transport system permease subunit